MGACSWAICLAFALLALQPSPSIPSISKLCLVGPAGVGSRRERWGVARNSVHAMHLRGGTRFNFTEAEPADQSEVDSAGDCPDLFVARGLCSLCRSPAQPGQDLSACSWCRTARLVRSPLSQRPRQPEGDRLPSARVMCSRRNRLAGIALRNASVCTGLTTGDLLNPSCHTPPLC